MTTAIALIALVLSIGAYVGQRLMWNHRDLSEFTTTLERLEQVADRIERITSVMASDMATARKHADAVAADLAIAKTAVETVASDLLSSQQRADTIIDGSPGEAADAGAQSEKV